MIYFFRAIDGTGNIKIGYSIKSVGDRLAAVQRIVGHPLVCLAVTEGGRLREGHLHEQFKSSSVGGEWFSPSRALLKEIAESRRRFNLWRDYTVEVGLQRKAAKEMRVARRFIRDNPKASYLLALKALKKIGVKHPLVEAA